MHETKYKLLTTYGCRCMMCGKYVPYNFINYHHIKPKYVSKADGEPPDNSFENGSLLCIECHCLIHSYVWCEDEYQLLTEIILKNKEDW